MGLTIAEAFFMSAMTACFAELACACSGTLMLDICWCCVRTHSTTANKDLSFVVTSCATLSEESLGCSCLPCALWHVLHHQICSEPPAEGYVTLLRDSVMDRLSILPLWLPYVLCLSRQVWPLHISFEQCCIHVSSQDVLGQWQACL